MKHNDPYWEYKNLDEMNKQEWEDLCDQCGKCCLNKIEYEGNHYVSYTNVVCKLFDNNTCACSDYSNRKKKVPDCIKLTPLLVKKLKDLPDTCAYRLIHKGEKLKPWHHLISGSRETIHEQVQSVKDKTINESQIDIDDLDNYLIKWVKPS